MGQNGFVGTNTKSEVFFCEISHLTKRIPMPWERKHGFWAPENSIPRSTLQVNSYHEMKKNTKAGAVIFLWSQPISGLYLCSHRIQSITAGKAFLGILGFIILIGKTRIRRRALYVIEGYYSSFSWYKALKNIHLIIGMYILKMSSGRNYKSVTL